MLNLAKTTGLNWLAHKDARLGAALAYYSIFSLGPIAIIAIAIAGFFFGQQAVRGEITSVARGFWGIPGLRPWKLCWPAPISPVKALFRP